MVLTQSDSVQLALRRNEHLVSLNLCVPAGPCKDGAMPASGDFLRAVPLLEWCVMTREGTPCSSCEGCEATLLPCQVSSDDMLAM